jgi:hypothetical protein
VQHTAEQLIASDDFPARRYVLRWCRTNRSMSEAGQQKASFGSIAGQVSLGHGQGIHTVCEIHDRDLCLTGKDRGSGTKLAHERS